MRKIDELFLEHERIWFYVGEEWKEAFFEEILSRNARFQNGTLLKREDIGCFMGVGRDGTVGYVSYFVWYSSFGSPYARVKIDYRKYRLGASDYIIMS